nr:ribonuclease H-like domain-containing protein [Tanacetum cinerariifolium]
NWVHNALLESSSSKPQDECSADVPESNILGVRTNSDESNVVEVDVSNMETTITASPTPTLRIHKDHPKSQIIGPVDTPIQTRNKSKQMDVKSAFLYGTIDEEVYVMQTPAIGFLKPFGCHVMILNTLDHLGKFDAKRDEGYFIGYSMSSKAFRVFNKRTKKVEENLHVNFLENKLIEKEAGPNWLFDIDTLTNSMNYVPVVVAGTSSTNFSSTKDAASQDVKKYVSSLRYIALPNWFHEAYLESSTSNA